MNATETPLPTKRVRPDWDLHGERLRTIRFTDFSRLSPEARAAGLASAQRVTAQLAALIPAFQQLGAAMERAGWGPRRGSGLKAVERRAEDPDQAPCP